MTFKEDRFNICYKSYSETSKEAADMLKAKHGHNMSSFSYVVLSFFYWAALKVGRLFAFNNREAIEYNRNVSEGCDLFFACFE